MRLLISLSGSSINELKFDRGPIYIGRQQGNQVFLPDPAVSRQHAVFYTTRDGAWILEDLGSANKTYLNQTAIHKSEVEDGDLIQIADFQIRVKLDEDENHDTMQKEDTLVPGIQIRKELHTVERRLGAADAPPIKFSPKRIFDFEAFMNELEPQRSLEALFKTLEDVLIRQFQALNVWVGLRRQSSGPFEIQGGRKITSETVQRLDLAVPESLDEALQQKRYMLIHQLPRPIINRGIRSVIIAPLLHKQECFGVIYIENSTEHSHFSLADIDYLLLLAVYTAHLIRRIK